MCIRDRLDADSAVVAADLQLADKVTPPSFCVAIADCTENPGTVLQISHTLGIKRTIDTGIPVSYTHLDVYKRQGITVRL